nr:urease accessory protein UreF [uncultured Gammaproteobacteria bacterium]
MSNTAQNNLSLLRLMQLSSPTLPVGAFAYSQGLESAIEAGVITNKESLATWLKDSLTFSLKNVDLPLFSRLYKSWESTDAQNVLAWNQNLFAQRETKELRDEDHQLGLALARLLDDLGIERAKVLRKEKQLCFLTLFTLAAVEWKIDVEQAANGFIWSWLDNQIAAAIKLVPLGQTDGQRVLLELLPIIPEIVEQGLAVKDDEIGASLPMMAILSSQHETQYSRLFRS